MLPARTGLRGVVSKGRAVIPVPRKERFLGFFFSFRADDHVANYDLKRVIYHNASLKLQLGTHGGDR